MRSGPTPRALLRGSSGTAHLLVVLPGRMRSTANPQLIRPTRLECSSHPPAPTLVDGSTPPLGKPRPNLMRSRAKLIEASGSRPTSIWHAPAWAPPAQRSTLGQSCCGRNQSGWPKPAKIRSNPPAIQDLRKYPGTSQVGMITTGHVLPCVA